MGKFKGLFSGLFGGGSKKPTPDPFIAEQRALAKKRADDEKAKVAEEASARRRGLRGSRSLLSGGFLGFTDDNDKTTLGS